jgi:hypothetical protein
MTEIEEISEKTNDKIINIKTGKHLPRIIILQYLILS